MIEVIEDHFVDTSLLKPGGYVLDLGCAGFKTVNSFLARGFNVVGVEPAPYNPPMEIFFNPNYKHIKKACVGIKNTDIVQFHEYQWGGANSIVMPPKHLHQEKYEGHSKNPFKATYGVLTTTISEIMEEFNISEFEYVKIDIEGAEYQLLENLPNGIKQFSVEFHDFLDLGPNPDNPEEYHEYLNNSVLTNYTKVKEKRGWRNNIDDCLYVRNDLI